MEIEVQNLWHEYGNQIVLENISLKVQSPAYVALVGASGCGKSTFLRLLLGQEVPTRGRILLDGSPMAAEPEPSRGVVYQRYSVFPHLSALENVKLGLDFCSSPVTGRALGKQAKQYRERAAQILEQVGLGDSKSKFPYQLSGGMQQRLAIAQALITEPRVLLLDEPFGALDPGIRLDMHHLMETICQARDMLVFMVTHDLHEGFKLADRLLVFDKPRIDPHAPERFGATVTYDLPLAKP